MGFRQLLNRAAKPEPPRLTELVGEQPDTPTTPSRQIRQLNRMRAAEPRSPAAPDKTPANFQREIEKREPPPKPVGRTAEEIVAAENTGPIDPRSWLAEKRQHEHSIRGLYSRRF